MKHRFYTADVFTNQPLDGVPISVFPEAEGLSDQQMQNLAEEIRTANTVFLFPGEKPHCRKIRIFTPFDEVKSSTHTILAASHVLAATNAVELNKEHVLITLEEEGQDSTIQPIETYVSQKNGEIGLIQQTYHTHAAIDYFTPTEQELAAMLSLTLADIGFEHYRPLIVSCGVPYLIVPIKSYHAIRAARFIESAWSKSSAPTSLAQEILLFANNTNDIPADFHARLLGPGIGINDDPPIGGAVAAFANHICDHPFVPEGTHVFAIQRGANDARKSLLYIEMDNKKIKDLTIRVGGYAVLTTESVMEF